MAKAAPKKRAKPARGERAHRRPEPHEPRDARGPVGVVKFFDARKGYGFIARDGFDDVFVHTTAVEASGLRKLEPGQRVAFEVEPGRRGEQATTLRLV